MIVRPIAEALIEVSAYFFLLMGPVPHVMLLLSMMLIEVLLLVKSHLFLHQVTKLLGFVCTHHLLLVILAIHLM